MVNYAEEADFGSPRRRRRSPAEIAARKAERAALRTEEEWHSYARDLCYRQLAMMERSVGQLRDAMERNLVPPDIAEETIRAFVEADLVNDERYAAMFVRTKFAGKTTSRRVLRRELARKGIGEREAQIALSQIEDADELRAASDFACRKAHSMEGLDVQTKRRRLYGALGRRGFSPDQIRQAMEDALGC